ILSSCITSLQSPVIRNISAGLTLTLFFFFVVLSMSLFFFFNDPATTEIYTLSLHDALPIWPFQPRAGWHDFRLPPKSRRDEALRSEEHTSELQSRGHLVCRLLLEKKKRKNK